MSEYDSGCRECSRQYQKLLAVYWYQRRLIRRMRRSFAAIECALTHDCDHASEFIVGECEAHRGKYEQRCLRDDE